jgi:hypothetical protein
MNWLSTTLYNKSDNGRDNDNENSSDGNTHSVEKDESEMLAQYLTCDICVNNEEDKTRWRKAWLRGHWRLDQHRNASCVRLPLICIGDIEKSFVEGEVFIGSRAELFYKVVIVDGVLMSMPKWHGLYTWCLSLRIFNRLTGSSVVVNYK